MRRPAAASATLCRTAAKIAELVVTLDGGQVLTVSVDASLAKQAAQDQADLVAIAESVRWETARLE